MNNRGDSEILMEKVAQHFIAHRGYSAGYPENTLPAIQAAIDAGAQFIEIDIQLTKDQQVVVFHDRDLQRLCQQPGTIYQYNRKDIADFSNFAPERFGEKFKGTAIPLLSEVVGLIHANPYITLFVEFKRISIEHFGAQTMLDIVLPELETISKQCVVISFSLDLLDLVRSKTTYPLGAVIDDWADAKTQQLSCLQKLMPEYFFCDIDTLPKDKKLSMLDSKIAVYECTDPLRAKQVLEQGVNFVETFDIKKMLDALVLNDS